MNIFWFDFQIIILYEVVWEIKYYTHHMKIYNVHQN